LENFVGKRSVCRTHFRNWIRCCRSHIKANPCIFWWKKVRSIC
jgi:hypothetical protein